MQLAVQPFVYRPHVEQEGVTITPDLSIRSVVRLDETGNATPVLVSALTHANVMALPGEGGAFQAALTFTQATFGLFVGMALVTMADGQLRQVAVARTAWRYTGLHDHTDQVSLFADGTRMGGLDQWTAEGMFRPDALIQGGMAVAPTGPLIEDSVHRSTVSVSLEDSREGSALSAHYQILDQILAE